MAAAAGGVCVCEIRSLELSFICITLDLAFTRSGSMHDMFLPGFVSIIVQELMIHDSSTLLLITKNQLFTPAIESH